MFKNAFLDNAHLDIETVLMFVNPYLRECFSYAFVKNEFGLWTDSVVTGSVFAESCWWNGAASKREK